MFSDMWSHRFIDFLLARETFKNKPVNSSDTTNYRQTGHWATLPTTSRLGSQRHKLQAGWQSVTLPTTGRLAVL